MGFVTALFFAFQTPIGIYHTGGTPPPRVQPEYICQTIVDDVTDDLGAVVEEFTIPAHTLQLGSFTCETASRISPSPTPAQQGQRLQAAGLQTVGIYGVITPAIGGPVPPDGYYCIDDVDPTMCDDSSGYLVPKGLGGAGGSCGTVIEYAHQLVAKLPQYIEGTRDALNSNVSSACASTGPVSTGDYISTYFVIDAYNLAGFSELSKTNANHVSPVGLFDWWKSSPAGYEFIPNSPTALQNHVNHIKDLTGCVMFLQTGLSYDVGIVNAFEQQSVGGDGILSILQAGSQMYIDRFPVSAWDIKNDSTNKTNTDGVVGFGCHL